MNKKFAGRRNKNEKEKQDVGNDISRNKLQGITRRSKENFYRSNFRVVARVLSHRGGVKSPGVVSRRLVKASLRANTCVFTPSDVSRRLWTSSRGSQGRNNWNNHPLIPRLLPLLDRETESTLPLEPGTRQRYHSLLPSSHRSKVDCGRDDIDPSFRDNSFNVVINRKIYRCISRGRVRRECLYSENPLSSIRCKNPLN